MLATAQSASLLALTDIQTAAGAGLGFPVWIFATWGVALVFALWVIYVVVRELRSERLEEELIASQRRLPPAADLDRPEEAEETEFEFEPQRRAS